MHTHRTRIGRPTILGLLLLGPLAACAAETEHFAFDSLDGDGIDLAELRAVGDEAFAALDADGDGRITEAEFAGGDGAVRALADGERTFVFVHDGPEAEGAFEVEVEVDTDDPRTHAFHWTTDAPRDDAAAFAAMDADGDGMLSLEEYRARPRPLPMAVEEIELRAGRHVAESFAGFDADGDGVVTREEWPSPERELARLDRDGDGIVSPDELAPGERRRIVIERRERRGE